MKIGRTAGELLLLVWLAFTACSGGENDVLIEPEEPVQVIPKITLADASVANGISFTADRNEKTIGFSCNVDWSIGIVPKQGDVGWCTVSKTLGKSGYQTVTFSAAENTDYEERSVVVTIKAGTASQAFTITQKGREKEPPKERAFPIFEGESGANTAFPGAEGYGRSATGARNQEGMQLYCVTNLNGSGTGSFSDAISQGNRIIIFKVAGVIDMGKKTYQFNSNQTILFQTAPGDGIELYNGRTSSSGANNLIIRYMRVRTGKGMGDGKDAAGLANGSKQIYDHCSIVWGTDENFSINAAGKAHDITLQNSIIGQGLQNHSCGGLMQTNDDEGVTLFRNLLIDNDSRNFKVKGLNQFVNNVVYNWGKGSAYDMGGDSGGHSNTVIENNYFIKGTGWHYKNTAYPKGTDYEKLCAEDPTKTFVQISSSGDVLIEEYIQQSISPPFKGGGGTGDFDTYCVGNYYDDNCDGLLNGIELTQTNWKTYCTATPVFLAKPDSRHATIKSQTDAKGAYEYMLTKVGASLPARDKVDAYLIEELTSLGTKGTIIKDQRNSKQYSLANTWQSINTANNITDSDNDGMPDAFEEQWGLNKNNAADAIAIAPNGYTNIENYCFSLEFPELYK